MTACLLLPCWNLPTPTSDGGKCLRKIAIETARHKFHNQEDRQMYIAGFEFFFLEGLLTEENSSSIFYPTNSPFGLGAKDGMSFARHRRERPVDFPSLAPKCFGYAWTNVEGRIFLASETAIIITNNGEKWWIENQQTVLDVEWEEKKSGPDTQEWDVERTSRNTVLIEGLVSPPGGYGHMARWERRVIVKKVSEEKAGQPRR